MAEFTTTPRAKVTWEAPTQVAVADNYFLNIGAGYNLLIATGYKLIIQPGRAGTTWTPTSKDYVAQF